MVAYDDSFMSDDDEDVCPLCIEEMDISDKNFKPCPCGFQICQFCYNNIRSNPELNGRCPACRRPYDDASIEYKTLTPEEIKRDQARRQKKELERKQREREKYKENDQQQKKHRASMRVIQKNLVYVIGLNPNIPPEELQQMLRRDEYFGQYGTIQKIVINRRVNGNGNPGIGVYVTFARKEDAARCIAAVDGSINDGKYLRAAYGTTKYCSSYLRNQNCPNPNCMFLHEPGEEADSFNRREASHQGVGASSGPSQAPQTVSAAGGAPHQPNSSSPTPVLAAASTPALPAWGKTAPQVPSTHRVQDTLVTSGTADTLRILAESLASLSMKHPTLDFRFVSDVLDPNASFPAMFGLPLDDKRRLKVYSQAVTELDKLSPPPPPPATEHGPGDATDTESSRGSEPLRSASASASASASSANPTPSPAPSSVDSSDLPRPKSNNSQQLLAHLLHDKQAKPEDIYSAIVSEVDKALVQNQPAISPRVADALRNYGADVTQPVTPPAVKVPSDVKFGPSNLVDSGPAFDLRDLPEADLVGDVEPSVWTALERRSGLRQLLATQEKEYAAARSQTKKRLKRLKV